MSSHPCFTVRRFEKAIADTAQEERSRRPIPVGPAVGRTLAGLRGTGRPLPAWLVSQAEHFLGRDLREVRIHAGRRVDDLTASLQTVAFCVGNDIFLDGRVLRSGNPFFALDVLLHELAHIAHAFEPERIRCWEQAGHERLTLDACASFSKEFDELVGIKELHLSKEQLIDGLKIACSNMDFRQRVFHPLATASYLFGYFTHIPFLAKGEGPRHGEGLNYRDLDPKANIRLNLKAQMESVVEAVKDFKEDRKHDYDDWIPTVRFRHVALNEKGWIKSLGNALHTAQDRAAHREGRKNFGHCDPRVAKGWGPDDPANDDHEGHDGEAGGSWWICNKAAFDKGFNNSCQVLEDFFKGIGLKHVRQAKRRSEFHSSAGAQHALHLRGCESSLEANTCWQIGCIHGERPGPTGWS